MRRREFTKFLGVAATTWPLAARAQQAGKVWRMGFIAHGHESFYDALFEGLRDYGYEEGRNLIVERRYAGGHAERFKEFAAEMVRQNVDVVVVVTTPAALAVMNGSDRLAVSVRLVMFGNEPMLTADRLRKLLTYNPGTGIFRWKVDRNNRRSEGDIAGHA